jgi:hypothetical protein
VTRFERVAVIGVGLIGGSFALALKRANACGTVVGVGRNAANLRVALERGAIDEIGSSATEAARDADLVLVAVPVLQMFPVFSAIAGVIGRMRSSPTRAAPSKTLLRPRAARSATHSPGSSRRIRSPARSIAARPRRRPACSKASAWSSRRSRRLRPTRSRGRKTRGAPAARAFSG